MVNIKKLQKGSVLSETQYYQAIEVRSNEVDLLTDDGQVITLGSEYVEKLLASADQFDKEEKKTRTELAEILVSNSRVVMTVNYNKQVKEADAVREIMDNLGKATFAEVEKAVKKGIKSALKGVERTMVGRHYSSFDGFGRLSFVDMLLDKGTGRTDERLRLVDPRTINWIIVNGVKYTVK